MTDSRGLGEPRGAGALAVSERHEVPIREEEDVIIARRKAQAMAQGLRFDAFATAAVTTATSELARNIFRHAGSGKVVLESVRDGARIGLRLEFSDQGPGIADVPRVLAGGYSTAGSLGLGVSGSRRLVDSFTLDSRPGGGTRVTVVKWKRF